MRDIDLHIGGLTQHRMIKLVILHKMNRTRLIPHVIGNARKSQSSSQLDIRIHQRFHSGNLTRKARFHIHDRVAENTRPFPLSAIGVSIPSFTHWLSIQMTCQKKPRTGSAAINLPKHIAPSAVDVFVPYVADIKRFEPFRQLQTERPLFANDTRRAYHLLNHVDGKFDINALKNTINNFTIHHAIPPNKRLSIRIRNSNDPSAPRALR